MSDIYEKMDVILNINSPTFAEDFRKALGLKEGETLTITTPQFTRTDGLQVPKPLIDFRKLPELSEETLKAIGCQKWDKPDENKEVLWLFPHEWYDHIPDGLDIVYISGRREKFKHGGTDNDMRFGALAYGFKRKAI